MASKNRIESNTWLRKTCDDIKGDILSIGSLTDGDGEGSCYKDYFKSCATYTTSEIDSRYNCDINGLDICDMSVINDSTYDCVFCSGVLEHVIDFHKGISEMHRVIKSDGVLLLGVPFRQAIHMAPNDYWRFTEYGIRAMLEDAFHIVEIQTIDNSQDNFPGAYWVRATKKVR
jgi:SAM-dependent methyltransferase